MGNWEYRRRLRWYRFGQLTHDEYFCNLKSTAKPGVKIYQSFENRSYRDAEQFFGPKNPDFESELGMYDVRYEIFKKSPII